MAKSTAFEADVLDWVFLGSSLVPSTSRWVSLHTAAPGSSQTDNEATYTSYARVEVSTAGWTRSGSTVIPSSIIGFPEATGGGDTITHAAIGTDSAGAGKVLYAGALSTSIIVSSGVTPRLTTNSAISES